MKILKFKLELTSEQFIKLPAKSEILDIQIQKNEPIMWAMCNELSEDIEIKLVMLFTGESLNLEVEQDYLGTVQHGTLVYHFFMEHSKN